MDIKKYLEEQETIKFIDKISPFVIAWVQVQEILFQLFGTYLAFRKFRSTFKGGCVFHASLKKR